ncbi:hypothetical protein NUU61_008599 [Penicillium alfredii]|uniref:Biogenesis of lysosome-related organelles complex 1 subunit 1 n=1 Tax=Penicillium alfredii TaxID=1506179 RepID=A0A9W9ELP0_9EURO|nr:uncharacterized protein NUU61_008599 [Penicillium alfredii]KAJ5084020.1 hypothetical protein NUU61_008599 [Penicillium alfredii]
MSDPTTQPQPPAPNSTTTDQQTKEAHAAFTATLHSVGANLEAPLRDRATTIQSNAAALERQETELAETTQRLARQNQQWTGLADETRDGLKEIGDVQNWAEMIERDLLVLEEMMGDVEGQESESVNGDVGVDADADGERRRVEEEVEGDSGDGRIPQNGDLGLDGGHHDAKDSKVKAENGTRSWFRWW